MQQPKRRPSGLCPCIPLDFVRVEEEGAAERGGEGGEKLGVFATEEGHEFRFPVAPTVRVPDGGVVLFGGKVRHLVSTRDLVDGESEAPLISAYQAYDTKGAVGRIQKGARLQRTRGTSGARKSLDLAKGACGTVRR